MGFGQFSNNGRSTHNGRAGMVARNKEGTRAKAVHSDTMVAHLWANKAQDHARTAHGNFYFDGDTIYSYGSHFPIARHVTQGKGKRARSAVLMTTRDYSVTTAKHISAVRGALRGNVLVLKVPRPDGVYDNALSKSGTLATVHGGAMNPRDYFAKEVRDAKAVLLAKRLVRSYDLAHFDMVRQNANDFAAFFGLRWTIKGLDTAEQVTLAAKLQKTITWDATNEARNIERRTRQRREAQEARENAALNRPWHLMAWLAGHAVTINTWEQGDTLLRVKGDTIETSRGATFPADHASLAFKFIKRARTFNKEWVRNGENIRLGHFQIDRITSTGDVHAGCHFVRWDAIEFAARQLGLLANV